MGRVPGYWACPAKKASGLDRTRSHHPPDIARVRLLMAVKCPRNTESDLLVFSASGPDTSIILRPNAIDQGPVEPQPSICTICTPVLNATEPSFKLKSGIIAPTAQPSTDFRNRWIRTISEFRNQPVRVPRRSLTTGRPRAHPT